MSATSVNGKVIAITGGARGIGLATAAELHGAGARIAIGDIDGDEAARAASGLGDGVLAWALDVADPGSFGRVHRARRARARPSRRADQQRGHHADRPAARRVPEVARRDVEINVLGVLTGMKLALAAMLAARQRPHRQRRVDRRQIAGPWRRDIRRQQGRGHLADRERPRRVRGHGINFTCVMPSFTATELIAGTKGTKLIANVEPEDVATAIARAIEKRKPDVYVPRRSG